MIYAANCKNFYLFKYAFQFIVNYVRKGKGIALECKGSANDRKNRPITFHKYQWVDHLSRGVIRENVRLFGNGTMLLRPALQTDSDVYTCLIYQDSDTIDKIIQGIIGKLHYY